MQHAHFAFVHNTITTLQQHAHFAFVFNTLTTLQQHAHFAFVASPSGNGLDCHRTWEALLLRSIPIVKVSVLYSVVRALHPDREGECVV